LTLWHHDAYTTWKNKTVEDIIVEEGQLKARRHCERMTQLRTVTVRENTAKLGFVTFVTPRVPVDNEQ
jgi:hypothetical protein